MKQRYSAGQVADAIGEGVDTLRQLRTRKYCLLGESRGQGHWQYSYEDACVIAVALALRRSGEPLSEVFTVVEGEGFKRAIDKAIKGSGKSDITVSRVEGGAPGHLWGSGYIFSERDPRGLFEEAWAARDALYGEDGFLAEQVVMINVSRIVRRVRALLNKANG